MDAPAVAVSRDGKKVAAAWMDMRAGTNNRDVQWTLGAGAPESTVNDVSSGAQGHPALAFASDGTLWCAWEDARSGPNARRIYVADAATRRNRPLSGEGEGNCGYPSMAAGGDVLGVVYETSTGATFRPILAR